MKSVFYHINRSLSLKLCLGILLFVVGVFVLSLGFLFERSRQMVKQEAMDYATHMLHNIALRVTGYLDEVERATDNMEWLVIENLQQDSLFSYTHRVVELNPVVNGCSITMEPNFFSREDGNFSVYSLREGDSIITVREGDYNYYEKNWYIIPRRQDKACWIDPYNDFNEGTLSSHVMIASYSKPLYKEDGQFVGVISTDIAITWLSNAISAYKPYPNSYCIMLGSDGTYFVHPDRLKLVKESIYSSVNGKEHPDIITLGHEMTSGKKGNMYVNIDGESCIVFYEPLADTPWSIAIVCPESDIARQYNTMVVILLPLILIGLVLMLLVCWKIVNHFIRPIDQLAQQSRQITDGHYDKTLPRSNREDVVGHLQNCFVSMQRAINEHVVNIRKVNEETEKRNSELLVANQKIMEADQRKTAFIHEVSLQIRTPLNIIAGFMQVLRETFSVVNEEELAGFTATMKQNTLTIYRMANMIFDVSRMDENTKVDLSKEVDVMSVVQESIKIFEEKQPFDVTLNFTSSLPDGLTVHTNRLYLYRILRELLINAKKFATKKEVSMSVEEVGDKLRFIFEDKGEGISEADREHIFDPFVKLSSFTEGLGLGLGLTLHHAVMLGGSLVLDPAYTDGARFIFEMPNK